MIITQTPLRISFLGGGTDLQEFYSVEDGFVISTTIDKYIYIIINERFDDLIYINYTNKERVSSPIEIKHDLVREALLKTGVSKGIEITMLADIPSEGSGLGSSSSLLIGLLNALYIFKGEQVTAERLASEACEIEIGKCGKPIGKQDQYIAAYGGLCSITFKSDESVDVKKIHISDRDRILFGNELMLFYTGITRKSADILTEQKNNTHNKFKELKNIKILAQKAESLLSNNKFEQIGVLLNDNWISKKKLASKIANPVIDNMYKRAMDAGALGGKISGAGGGGFMLLYTKSENQNKVREALAQYKEMPFFLESDGSKVIFNYKKYSWK